MCQKKVDWLVASHHPLASQAPGSMSQNKVGFRSRACCALSPCQRTTAARGPELQARRGGVAPAWGAFDLRVGKDGSTSMGSGERGVRQLASFRKEPCFAHLALTLSITARKPSSSRRRPRRKMPFESFKRLLSSHATHRVCCKSSSLWLLPCAP